jgi:hypothetical protein
MMLGQAKRILTGCKTSSTLEFRKPDIGRLTESSEVTRSFHLLFIIANLDHVPLSFRILHPLTELLHEDDFLDLPFWKEDSQTLMLMVLKNVENLTLYVQACDWWAFHWRQSGRQNVSCAV